MKNVKNHVDIERSSIDTMVKGEVESSVFFSNYTQTLNASTVVIGRNKTFSNKRFKVQKNAPIGLLGLHSFLCLCDL